MLLALSMFSIFFILVFMIRLIRGSFGVFNIILIFVSLMLLDTLIPAIIWYFLGQPDMPAWFTPLTELDLTIGLLFYLIFYFGFILSFYAFLKKTTPGWHVSPEIILNESFRNKLLLLLCFVASMFLLDLYLEILNYGGWKEWVVKKFTVRFGVTQNPQSFLEKLLLFIPWRVMFNALVFLAFLFRYSHKRPFLYGVLFPLLSILFAVSTSYRGSILTLLLGLIFIEYVRIKIHRHYGNRSKFGRGKETIHKPKYYFFGFSVILIFLVYGAVRENYATEKLGYVVKTDSVIFKVLNQGSGLQGISSIVSRYGGDVDYLVGKTYFDMLLLPIPRAIYSSKPDWYGIDDITKGMGWPETTQSAVTIPGEAYANFGFLGVIMSLFWGAGIAALVNIAKSGGLIGLILYPTIGFQLIFVSNWMAFTGVMNLFFTIIFVILMLKILTFKFNIKKLI